MGIPLHNIPEIREVYGRNWFEDDPSAPSSKIDFESFFCFCFCFRFRFEVSASIHKFGFVLLVAVPQLAVLFLRPPFR